MDARELIRESSVEEGRNLKMKEKEKPSTRLIRHSFETLIIQMQGSVLKKKKEPVLKVFLYAKASKAAEFKTKRRHGCIHMQM